MISIIISWDEFPLSHVESLGVWFTP